MKKILYIVCAALLFVGCKHEAPKQPTLVFEGWIDASGTPVVLIHKSYTLDITVDRDIELSSIVERQLIPFGKVTISDGADEVVLTGKLDTTYLPPYTYTSLDMRGQVGKTYTVTAKYNDLYATATTTIPPIAYIDSLSVRGAGEDIMDLRAYMSHINPDEDAYYAFFLKQFGDKQYQFCPFCVFEGKDATDGKMEVRLYNPLVDRSLSSVENYYFHNDSTKPKEKRVFQLKVARIDYESYQFWKAYNEQIITRGILFVPVYRNIPGNVRGGYGYFSGMGSSFYIFDISRDSTYRFSPL